MKLFELIKSYLSDAQSKSGQNQNSNPKSNPDNYDKLMIELKGFRKSRIDGNISKKTL